MMLLSVIACCKAALSPFRLLGLILWKHWFWFKASLPRPPRHHFGRKKFPRENWYNSTSRRARDLPNSSKRSSLRELQVPQQSWNPQNCSWGSTAPIKMSWYRRPRAFFVDAFRIKKSHKTADLFRNPLSPPPPPRHLRTLMGVFFLKARTGDSRHLAKKARMLPFLGKPILFIRNS